MASLTLITLSKQMYDGVADPPTALEQLRAQVKDRQGRAGQGAAADAVAALDQKAAAGLWRYTDRDGREAPAG